jgi:hypothetical protein
LIDVSPRIAEVIFAARKPPDPHKKDFVLASWVDDLRHPQQIWSPDLVWPVTTPILVACPKGFPINGCQAKVDITIEDLSTLPSTVRGIEVEAGYGRQRTKQPPPQLTGMSFAEFRFHRCSKGVWDTSANNDDTIRSLLAGPAGIPIAFSGTHALARGCDPNAKWDPRAVTYFELQKEALIYAGDGRWMIRAEADTSHRYFRFESVLLPENLPLGNSAYARGTNGWRVVQKVSGPFGDISIRPPTDSFARYGVRDAEGNLYVFAMPRVTTGPW